MDPRILNNNNNNSASNNNNKIAFNDNVLSILKGSFVCFLWSETKLFIKNGPSTLIGFIVFGSFFFVCAV